MARALRLACPAAGVRQMFGFTKVLILGTDQSEHRKVRVRGPLGLFFCFFFILVYLIIGIDPLGYSLIFILYSLGTCTPQVRLACSIFSIYLSGLKVRP